MVDILPWIGTVASNFQIMFHYRVAFNNQYFSCYCYIILRLIRLTYIKAGETKQQVGQPLISLRIFCFTLVLKALPIFLTSVLNFFNLPKNICEKNFFFSKFYRAGVTNIIFGLFLDIQVHFIKNENLLLWLKKKKL